MPSFLLMLNTEDDIQPKISLVTKLMLLQNLTRAMLQLLNFLSKKKKSQLPMHLSFLVCLNFFLPYSLVYLITRYFGRFFEDEFL